MKVYLESSLLYCAYSWLLNTYKQSKISFIASTMGKWHENSVLHKLLNNYVRRRSTAQDTITYRILGKTGKKADFFVGKVHDSLSSYIKSSFVSALYETLKTEWTGKSNLLILTAILPFLCSYILFIAVRGLWDARKAATVLLSGIICILAFSVSGKWRPWINNSLTYRFCQYFWE